MVEPESTAELSRDALGVLEELAGGWPGWGRYPKKLPWYPVRQIQLWAGREAIHEVLAAGLVEQWTGVRHGPYLVLTPLGAAVAQVELYEPIVGQAPEWLDPAKRTGEMADHCASGRIREHRRDNPEDSFPYPDRIPDPTPSTPRRTRRIAVQPLRDKWTGAEIRLFAGPNGEGEGVPIMATQEP